MRFLYVSLNRMSVMSVLNNSFLCQISLSLTDLADQTVIALNAAFLSSKLVEITGFDLGDSDCTERSFLHGNFGSLSLSCRDPSWLTDVGLKLYPLLFSIAPRHNTDIHF